MSNVKHKETFYGTQLIIHDQVKSQTLVAFRSSRKAHGKSQSLNVIGPCQIFSGTVHSNIVYTVIVMRINVIFMLHYLLSDKALLQNNQYGSMNIF